MADPGADQAGPSIRSDLYHGTLYGLGLSAGLWTMVLWPPFRDPAAILLLAMSLTAALFETRSRLLGRFTATYVFVLTGLVLFGPGTSLAAGLIAISSRRLLARGRRQGARTRQATFEAGAVALATTVAAAAWSFPRDAIVHSGPVWQTMIWPVARHAAFYALTLSIVDRLAVSVACARWTLRPRIKTVVQSFLRFALAALIGCALIWLFQRPDLRAAAMALALLLSGYAIHAARHARRKLAHRHELQMAAVCNSVVQALARLMLTKDADTQKHVRRVQRLCLEVGTRLRLGSAEIDALSAAALLHDIGKVAVPEQILSKPGRLSSSEMARMRVHPDVGADLLESIPFPYDVASIVRHHHERWDGHGYPAGLRGTEIPRGARILAAVDSYDALTSERHYRKALEGEDALAFLQRESGRAFDPAIVEALLDQIEASMVPRSDPLVHATDLELPDSVEELLEEAEQASLPRAEQELQMLYDVRRAGRHDLSLDEYITLVACKLAPLVAHRSLVVYFLDRNEPILRAACAIGEASDRLGLMKMPVGERVSGLAAQQQRACIGNATESPLDRYGTRSDLDEWREEETISELTSSIAAPINVDGTTLGVLTLYGGDGRRFNTEDCRILVRVAGHVGLVVQRIRQSLERTPTSLTDPLTGLPNARFLWVETGHRLSRALHESSSFGLLAFRVLGLEQIGARLGQDETDRLLCQLARRFAASCTEEETLVRFGENLFTVLTPTLHTRELIARWQAIAQDVEEPELSAKDGAPCTISLTAAHASSPDDGEDLETLLTTLDHRLGPANRAGGKILPFRSRTQAAG